MMDIFQCPDTGKPLWLRDNALAPSNGGRVYEKKYGVWRLLPSHIEDLDAKNREKRGWEVLNDGLYTDEFLMQLP